MRAASYFDSNPHSGSNPSPSALILTAVRWLGLLAALWLLWDSAAFALVPRLLFVPF
jgi:hypothetical protein